MVNFNLVIKKTIIKIKTQKLEKKQSRKKSMKIFILLENNNTVYRMH